MVKIKSVLIPIFLIVSVVSSQTCTFGDDIKVFFSKSKRDTCGLITKNGTCYAILIGLNDYSSNPNILQLLSKPENEVNTLDTLLSRQGYVVKTLKGSQCKYDTLKRWLNCIVEGAHKNDRIFVYFVGHAMRLSDISPNLCESKKKRYFEAIHNVYEEKRKQYYLNSKIWSTIRDSLIKENCFSDLPKLLLNKNAIFDLSRLTFNKQGPDGLETSDPLCLMLKQNDMQSLCEFITVEEIAREMNVGSAHQKVLIIDACYSGDMNKLFYMPLDLYSPRILEDGFFIMTGASRPQLQGKVSPVIFYALNGAADLKCAGNRDGFVSLYETTVFVDDSLRRDTTINELYKSRYIFIGSGDIKISKRKDFTK